MDKSVSHAQLKRASRGCLKLLQPLLRNRGLIRRIHPCKLNAEVAVEAAAEEPTHRYSYPRPSRYQWPP